MPTDSTGPPSTSPSTGRPKVDFDRIKVGYIEERSRPTDDREELKVLRKLGFELVPITLPEELPVRAITLMLGTEAAAVFDEITRKHITEGLEHLAQHVPQRPVRAGRRVPAGRPRANQADAGDGRADGNRRPLRRVGRGPVDHEPDRPPDRRLPDGLPRSRRADRCPARSHSPAGSTTRQP